ncbi:MAG: twin-arginine translocase subunit TatC [Phycisphaerales bacterium]|nr:twin-arginine translocase subunit TatC [Phycisphaerales bacterium]
MKILGRNIGRAANPDDASAGEYMDRTRMSFGDHLEELRLRLMLGLLGVVVGAVIGLLSAKPIMTLLFQPLFAVQDRHHLPTQLLGSTPQAGFSVYMKVGLLSGVILAGPWLLYQAWQFVASGLYPKEQRFARRFVPASGGLFILGVLFMYMVALPIVLNFFVAFNKSFAASYNGITPFQKLLLGDEEGEAGSKDGATNPGEKAGDTPAPRIPILENDPKAPQPGDIWFNRQSRILSVQGDAERWSVPLIAGARRAIITGDFTVDSYTSFVLMLALAFGLAFQLPIAVLFLAWTGIVSVAQMRKSRRIIILIIFIVAAVLTPPDVFSQMLLAIPMCGLFEIGLLIARSVERRREQA